MQTNGSFVLEGSSSFGVLLLHGFTANAAQMRDLAQQLHAQGYTASVPQLPGHGGRAEDLEEVTWRDWIACARAEYTALKQRCERVAVAGLSMGGALAALLAEEYPVDAFIAYSPCVRMKQAIAWAARIVQIGHVYQKNKEGRREFPLSKGYDVWRLASRAMLSAFAITAPALIFQSALDTTIDPRGARRLYEAISSEKKEYVWLEKSPHVCTHGPEKEQLFEKTVAFLNNVRDE